VVEGVGTSVGDQVIVWEGNLIDKNLFLPVADPVCSHAWFIVLQPEVGNGKEDPLLVGVEPVIVSSQVC
jgi:hypothetical protein